MEAALTAIMRAAQEAVEAGLDPPETINEGWTFLQYVSGLLILAIAASILAKAGYRLPFLRFKEPK